MSVNPTNVSHPSQHRHRVSVAVMLVALVLGPLAWVLQLVGGYAVSSAACFPGTVPWRSSPPPGWSHEAGGLLLLNCLCLAITIAGLVIAALCWQNARHKDPGDRPITVEIGEGRDRFLAVCGMLGNFGFAVAIGFDTVVVLGTPTCWSIAS